MGVRFFSSTVGLGLLLATVPSYATAQEAAAALIDQDLSEQIDFRSLAFGLCFSQPTCTVEGVTITAERRDVAGDGWVPALIYWDPMDGLGVLEGGQNDEIDFDERLTVSFNGLETVERVWLSDLFIGEDRRYGSYDPAGDPDVETAGIQFMRGEAIVSDMTVDGMNILPQDPFDQIVSSQFREDGDLYRRIVVRDNVISVVAPGANSWGRTELLTFPIDEIDEDKLAIFEGIETTEVDLTDIILGFNDVPLFSAGSHNANVILAALNDEALLQSLRDTAEDGRVVGSRSNGELGVDITPATPATALSFVSVFGGSNDFSVAGIVLAGTRG